MTQRIVTNLWFDGQAEQAATYWSSIFPDSRITMTTRYPEGSPGTAGEVMTVEFELFDQRFVGINGGPAFPHTEAMSLMIECEDQAEIDRYWAALIADGGAESQCGWCKDRWGVNWQVVPTGMDQVFADPDPLKAQRAFTAMLGMRKLDLAELQRAAAGS